MSWSQLINKNPTNSVPWGKQVINILLKGFICKISPKLFLLLWEEQLASPVLQPRLPSQSSDSCFSLRFKGGAGGLALAGKWEMNLEETSSVTLETSGTAVLQTESLDKQIPMCPALCRTCPHVGVRLLHSWFCPLVVKEEQQQFTVAERCRNGRFTL